MKNLKIKEEEKNLKGTLAWWEALPKETYVLSRGTYPNTPNLWVDFGEGVAYFLAEIAHEESQSCRQMNGCNVVFVVGVDERFDEALFWFPVTKKCHEAIDKFIETEVEKFVSWWENV